jgi:protease-4
VYLASEALKMGLVDEIGYLNDAIAQAQKLAGLPENSRVVVYRRSEHANDNVYNDATTRAPVTDKPLIDLGVAGGVTDLPSGFYYLWTTAVSE